MAPTSKPKFVTKPPIRPRRIRADGISREPAERRKPVESESENVSRKSIIVDKSVNNPELKGSSTQAGKGASEVKVKLTAAVKKYLKEIKSDFVTHAKLISQLSNFA